MKEREWKARIHYSLSSFLSTRGERERDSCSHRSLRGRRVDAILLSFTLPYPIRERVTLGEILSDGPFQRRFQTFIFRDIPFLLVRICLFTADTIRIFARRISLKVYLRVIIYIIFQTCRGGNASGNCLYVCRELYAFFGE